MVNVYISPGNPHCRCPCLPFKFERWTARLAGTSFQDSTLSETQHETSLTTTTYLNCGTPHTTKQTSCTHKPLLLQKGPPRRTHEKPVGKPPKSSKKHNMSTQDYGTVCSQASILLPTHTHEKPPHRQLPPDRLLPPCSCAVSTGAGYPNVQHARHTPHTHKHDKDTTRAT